MSVSIATVWCQFVGILNREIQENKDQLMWLSKIVVEINRENFSSAVSDMLYLQ